MTAYPQLTHLAQAAVTAYVHGTGQGIDLSGLDAVAAAMGAAAAERLEPHLKQLTDEAVHRPVDWFRHDLLSAMGVGA